jgi:hypothetical protein
MFCKTSGGMIGDPFIGMAGIWSMNLRLPNMRALEHQEG